MLKRFFNKIIILEENFYQTLEEQLAWFLGYQ